MSLKRYLDNDDAGISKYMRKKYMPAENILPNNTSEDKEKNLVRYILRKFL